MKYSELMSIIKPVIGFDFDKDQQKVIQHTEKPLWIIAGPGSGKTEVLVIRTLKLLFVDRINPKSIFITTFTIKAAKNLFDRIINYASYIYVEYPKLEQEIDIHSLRIGTLHGLCSDIMLEFRYPNYENFKILDDIEQKLFIYGHSSVIRDNNSRKNYLELYEKFPYLFGYSIDSPFIPNRWKRVSGLERLLNRIIEDEIDLERLKNEENGWQLVYSVFEEYQTALEEYKRCDFANIQLKFLNFLRSNFGKRFIKGENNENNPGIRYVLVDEYQDTNPIQEEIYFEIAKQNQNLCIVGDDDQSLYRFRGGTVSCMVNFDKACKRKWNYEITKKNKVFLNSNYRSHEEIVKFYDDYITSFGIMNRSGARVDDKYNLEAKSDISGDYPAVGYIRGGRIRDAAINFALFVKTILDNGIINKPSDCVLLMRSVKESPRNAGPFAEELRNVGIIPYNPRSRTFLDQEEIMGIMGAFILVIEGPELSALNTVRVRGINPMVTSWVETFNRIASQELLDYVNKSRNKIVNSNPEEYLDVTILEIVYRIISHEPFSSWKENDPERSYRIGKLTKLFESYSSTPIPGYIGSTRGKLKTSSMDGPVNISFAWRRSFYYTFVGLLNTKGINDPEDEELITPPDRLPIMTVHQAKGLEFPFVFVYNLADKGEKEDSSALLEDELLPLRKTIPKNQFTSLERTQQDIIRFYYVAFSRAMYSLISIVPNAHRRGGFGFRNKSFSEFEDNVTLLE